MLKILSRLQQGLIWSIPAAMLLGLLLGASVDASALQLAILPLTLLMVYPSMVGLNLKTLRSEAGPPRLHLTAIVLNFVVLPLLGWGLGALLLADQPAARLALLLTALLPTSGMSISWTAMARGNVVAAVKMTVVGLIAGSLLAPFYLRLLLGAVIEVPVPAVMTQIGLVVFLPLLLGLLTQRGLIARHGDARFHNELKPAIGSLSTLGVLGIVFVSMAIKAPELLQAPQRLLTLLSPLLLLYAANFAIVLVLGRRHFEPADAIALVYGTVMRNLSIALAIALSAFGHQGAEAALLIALAYLVQVQSAAWSLRPLTGFLSSSHFLNRKELS